MPSPDAYAKTAWLWACARDDRPFGGSGPPMVVCHFEDSRAGDRVARHLSGYRGTLQVDGHGAYNKLVRSDGGNDGVILAGCWSHSRRKFYELHASDSSRIATETVELNNVDPQAWLTQTLERIAKGWPSSDLDALMPWNYEA